MSENKQSETSNRPHPTLVMDCSRPILCLLRRYNVPKMRLRPGLCPGPRWGSLRRSPDPLVVWGGGYPLPIPTPLGAFGARHSAPSAIVPAIGLAQYQSRFAAENSR